MLQKICSKKTDVFTAFKEDTLKCVSCTHEAKYSDAKTYKITSDVTLNNSCITTRDITTTAVKTLVYD